MKKLAFALFAVLLPQLLQAQVVTTLYPQENPTGRNWTEIAADTNKVFSFYFPGSFVRTSYAGFCEVVVHVDSATSAGDGDSLTVSVNPLFYDRLEAAYKSSGYADRDSIDIVNLYDWGTSDDDDEYDVNASANLPPCDGAQVRVYTGANAQCKVRVELRITILSTL